MYMHPKFEKGPVTFSTIQFLGSKVEGYGVIRKSGIRFNQSGLICRENDFQVGPTSTLARGTLILIAFP